MTDLSVLTDAVAVSKVYRLTLGAAALRHCDQRPEFAAMLRAAADVAGTLADEYAAVALFHWCNSDTEAA